MSQELFEPGEIAPHSQQAEEALLGSVLINPSAYQDVSGFLTSEDFFILRNDWIWEAMERLHKRGDRIEYLTVVEELKSQNRLDDIGGSAYVTYLASNTATSVHAEAYGQIVFKAAVRRRLEEAALEIRRLAREEDMDIWEVISKSEAALANVTEAAAASQQSRPTSEAREELVSQVLGVQSGKLKVPAVPTYTTLDRELTGNGLQEGLWILTADTSGNKSNILTNWLTNMALKGDHVSLHTLEMRDTAVLKRILSRLSWIGSRELTEGNFNDLDAFHEGLGKLINIEDLLHIDDKPNQNMYQIGAKIRSHRRNYGIVCAGVDYMGLISTRGMDTRGKSRYDLLGEISGYFQQLSRELHIPIVMAHQQNREGGGLKGVADSYNIARDADGIIYVYDPHPAEVDDDEDMVVPLDVVNLIARVDKQREGRQWGKVPLTINLTKHAIMHDPDKR